MNRPIIISLVVAGIILTGLALLFFEDKYIADKNIELIYPTQRQIESVGIQNATANLLEKDNIKALAMITRSDAGGKQMSKEITDLYLTNGLAEAKVEIMYHPEQPISFDVVNNISKVLESMLRGYEEQEIGVIIIGLEKSPEILEYANNFENLKTISWYGIEISQ